MHPTYAYIDPIGGNAFYIYIFSNRQLSKTEIEVAINTLNRTRRADTAKVDGIHYDAYEIHVPDEWQIGAQPGI